MTTDLDHHFFRTENGKWLLSLTWPHFQCLSLWKEKCFYFSRVFCSWRHCRNRAKEQRRRFLKTAGLSISELCGGNSANQPCILTLAKHVAWFFMSWKFLGIVQKTSFQSISFTYFLFHFHFSWAADWFELEVKGSRKDNIPLEQLNRLSEFVLKFGVANVLRRLHHLPQQLLQ